ncbi:HTH CENPB-type domain-containing protein [Mycena kentingensis (nom. inval.)]|nr:HTH CENPB-type domain-containing protein [Mycena kentingensis (nom. inval.)]
MMASSLETSVRGHLPVPPSTPIRAVTNFISDMHRAKRRRVAEDGSDDDRGEGTSASATALMNTLHNTSSSFFLSSSPIHAPAPSIPSALISPQKSRKRRYQSVLSLRPATPAEADMQAIIRELLEDRNELKSQLVSMQAGLVLNGSYCDVLRGQLVAYEERKKRKGEKNGRLVGDGMPRLLTSAEFLERVSAFQAAAASKEAALAARKATREELKPLMDEWRELEMVRKAWNEEVRLDVAEELERWKAEKQRLGKNPPGWKRPSAKGQIISPVPKPSIARRDGVETQIGDDNFDASSSEESETE